MSSPAVGGVFISYRRQESSGITGRLYDRLAARFGDAQVFMDVDTIALGADFTQVVAQAVSNCTVLLAVIGPGWLTAADEDGQRRLDDPDDIVRLEIQAALERDIRVIPILVENAVMPRGRQLPEELAGLARRNAHFLRHESFRSDADRLLKAIEPILASAGASVAASGPAQVMPVATDPSDKITPQRPQYVLRLAHTLTGHNGGVFDVAFSPDGRLLASCTWREVRLWDPATGEHRRLLTGQTGLIEGVAFSPDGRLLASCGVEPAVWLWDPATGKRPRTLTGHSSLVKGVAFSPDGRLLASCGYDKTVRLWDPATGEHQRTLTGHTDGVYGVAFSPDGRLLASCGSDKTVRLWDPATGKHQRTLTGHTGGVNDVAFSPDGRLLASCCYDKTVRLWDPATGEHRRTLVGHTDKVEGVTFSPAGRLVASCSYDTVRLWDPATGENLHTLTGVGSGVAFSPDGRLLASCGKGQGGGPIQLWDLTSTSSS